MKQEIQTGALYATGAIPEKKVLTAKDMALLLLGRQQGMVQGICLIVADILRGYSMKEAWQGAGITIEEMEQCGVDEYDLKEIKSHINELG